MCWNQEYTTYEADLRHVGACRCRGMVECKKMQETIRSTAKRTQVQDLLPAWWFATLSSTKGPAAATFDMPTAERLASDLVQFGHPVAAVAAAEGDGLLWPRRCFPNSPWAWHTVFASGVIRSASFDLRGTEVMRFPAWQLHVLPPGTPWELAVLAEPLATACKAVRLVAWRKCL